ncbi:MAG: glycine oxidase ThiO [Proteobacteria bacterium]|nr:glycine oxidase ThiO [Cystobacterineae bacterium]MCL2258544.1 glycine oxidase ThiO [Cystobacterineae bacterium]MCL2315119.1 glycine oxidase ThiO [Pseudomonadota bacterium]
MDVLILGGGIIGLSIAHRLARMGKSCTLIDAATPGQEASASSGGMIAPQMEAHHPGPLLELGLASRKLWPEFAAQLQQDAHMPVELRRFGSIRVALEPNQAEELKQTAQWQKKQGLPLEWLGVHETLALEPALSPHILNAIHFPEELQVDPPALMRALLAATLQAGVHIQRKKAQALLEYQGHTVGALVENERIEAKLVVVAMGAWSPLLQGLPLPPHALFPCRGQMVDVALPRPLFRHFIMATGAYAIPRTDGRVTLGSTMENVGFDKNNTPSGLHHILGMAQNYCPQLATANFVRCWAGLRPATTDDFPILSKTPQGLILATGHFRNGIALAPITAQLVAELVCGKTPSFDITPLCHIRFDNTQA